MKTITIALLILGLAALAVAADWHLEPTAPAKASAQLTAPPASPETIRQGGDTIADAVTIAIPYNGAGTTAGYTNDYDEVCPYSGSTSPDVVYTFTVATARALDVDLAGSSYDTKVYLYDAALELIACNDDYHPDYTSRIEGVEVAADETYYLVIDGYGGDAGEYALAIEDFIPCDLTIPADALPEGEPPLVNGYIDCYNNGCQTSICDGVGTQEFQYLEGNLAGELVFHGLSGWYIGPDGGQYREGDYFIAYLGDTGVMEITMDAEYALYMFEIRPTDCASMAVYQNVVVGPCAPATMTVTGDPGQEIWLLPLPTTFEPPYGADGDGDGLAEFDYLLEFTGMAPGVVSTEAHSWSEVKAMYR
jgi:hypothetical protein